MPFHVLIDGFSSHEMKNETDLCIIFEISKLLRVFKLEGMETSVIHEAVVGSQQPTGIRPVEFSSLQGIELQGNVQRYFTLGVPWTPRTPQLLRPCVWIWQEFRFDRMTFPKSWWKTSYKTLIGYWSIRIWFRRIAQSQCYCYKVCYTLVTFQMA